MHYFAHTPLNFERPAVPSTPAFRLEYFLSVLGRLGSGARDLQGGFAAAAGAQPAIPPSTQLNQKQPKQSNQAMLFIP